MKLYTLALTLLLAVAPCSQAATDEDAVRSTTSAILEQLNQNRDRLQKDPQVIQQVVDLVIDSVSLVRNYRGMYQSQINLHGLDYFISNFQGCGNEHIVQ